MRNISQFFSSIICFILYLCMIPNWWRLKYFSAKCAPQMEVYIPPTHIALGGDLPIQIVSSSLPSSLVQLSRLDGNSVQVLTTITISSHSETSSRNITNLKIPCGYFSRGGQYHILIRKQHNKNSSVSDVIMSRGLDVRWPLPQLFLTPDEMQTYPNKQVTTTLEFPDVKCRPIDSQDLPEFWLEMHYCGNSLLTCDNDSRQNKSAVQLLYSVQIIGLHQRKILPLKCELFGLAGNYAMFLRPKGPMVLLPHTAAYAKVQWSEEFVFNVHARSIFPCDVHNGGIPVLFQYPSCILASGDKIRLFARLRANVASLAPPTSLEYVAEKRVTKGQHTLHFDCDLFTERYVEYCFVYVSQAITGAVADVRMDCVPTLPVSDAESGGWGPWSSWTACSSTCVGGTRSRYRFCDSPPPRFGAKFCEGNAVETEKCGSRFGLSWECLHSNTVAAEDVVATHPEIESEMGQFCRCGCVVHLGRAKPKRLLTTSSKSCPGRSFWLIQAEDRHTIQFKVEQFNLVCGAQWLKIRDGGSLSSLLLAHLSNKVERSSFSYVNSSGTSLLLEFFSDENVIKGQVCGGGFLAYATQSHDTFQNASFIEQSRINFIPSILTKLSRIHITAVLFLFCLLIATSLLGVQYLLRYRKYHIAQGDEQDSLTDPSASCTNVPTRIRSVSNPTLFSEVISLAKLTPILKNKHVRLRDSMYYSENDEVTLAKEESLSSNSSITLTQCSASLQAHSTSDADRCSSSLASTSQMCGQSIADSNSTIEKDKVQEKEDYITNEKHNTIRRLSNPIHSSLKQVRTSLDEHSKSDPGSYSPAMHILNRTNMSFAKDTKETKNKKNQQKLFCRPGVVGSDFSLGVDTDLEMDYYDYNVTNAGAAPGSYFGMDPAFLVWIPPLDSDGEILPPVTNEVPKHKRTNKFSSPTASSNKSPKTEGFLNKIVRKTLNKNLKQSDNNIQISKVKDEKISVTEILPSNRTSIPLNDLSSNSENKILNITPKHINNQTENILDNIKFVDDDDDDDNISNMCNKNILK